MFQAACRLHLGTMARVGGVGDAGVGRSFGLGCAMSPRHVLTAAHVAQQGLQACGQASALVGMRLHRCEVVYRSDKLDLAVLQLGKVVFEHKDHWVPDAFPKAASQRPGFGMSVGYMGVLRRAGDSYSSFSPASLSFFMRDGSGNWALSGGFIESGFSGGPVFLPDGSVIGLMIQSMQFTGGADNQVPHLHTVPVMSPLYLAGAELSDALAG